MATLSASVRDDQSCCYEVEDLLGLRNSVASHRFAVLVQFVTRPEQPTRDEVQIHAALHGAVAVTEGGCENTPRAVSVQPDHDVVFLRLLTVGLSQWHQVRPKFF